MIRELFNNLYGEFLLVGAVRVSSKSLLTLTCQCREFVRQRR